MATISHSHIQQCLNLATHISLRQITAKIPSHLHNYFPSFLRDLQHKRKPFSMLPLKPSYKNLMVSSFFSLLYFPTTFSDEITTTHHVTIFQSLKIICRGYFEMCRKYKIKFGGSMYFSQIIFLTKQNQNLNNFRIKVYYSAGILWQGTHNVVVVIFANVVVVVFADVVVVAFAFGVRRNGNIFARQRGASQVLVK